MPSELVSIKSFRKIGPFVVLAMISIIYSFTAKLGLIDDQYFIKIYNGVDRSLLEFIKLRFETWSSRIFIESLLVFFVNQHLLWRFVNSLTLFGTGILMLKLIGRSDDYLKWLVVFFISIYPYTDMASAGWIATTLNYSWPLFFGLIALLPLRLFSDQIVIHPLLYPVFALFTLLAANVEQMAGVLFCIFSVAIIKDFLSKKVKALLIIQYVIILFNLLLIFISPGNYVRRVSEIGTWFPEYAQLSFVRLFEMGFSSTLYPLVFKANAIFLVFALVVLLRSFLVSKDSRHIVMSAIPLTIFLLFNVFVTLLNPFFPVLVHINQALTVIGTGASISHLMSLIPDFILLIVILTTIVSLYYSVNNHNRFLLILGVLLLGFISRFVIAFSPTIWASVERTFIFFYFSIIFVSLVLIMDTIEEVGYKLINNTYIRYFFFLFMILSIINNIYLVTYRF